MFKLTINGRAYTARLTGEHTDFALEAELLATGATVWITYEQYLES